MRGLTSPVMCTVMVRPVETGKGPEVGGGGGLQKTTPASYMIAVHDHNGVVVQAQV
jgi:hypothetical protein